MQTWQVFTIHLAEIASLTRDPSSIASKQKKTCQVFAYRRRLPRAARLNARYRFSKSVINGYRCLCVFIGLLCQQKSGGKPPRPRRKSACQKPAARNQKAEIEPGEKTRKPLLLSKPSGMSLSRSAQRALTRSKFHEPPRTLLLTCSLSYHEFVHSQTFPLISLAPASLLPLSNWPTIVVEATS